MNPNPAADQMVRFLQARIQALTRELEVERMRLAACGVVAMANTPDSAAKARDIMEEYRSASCDDVANAVDREMRLRADNAALVYNIAHWKNNHATEVRRARILKERPDLPIERVQAYEKWGEDQAQLAKFKAALEKLACLGNGDAWGNSIGNCIAQEALGRVAQ